MLYTIIFFSFTFCTIFFSALVCNNIGYDHMVIGVKKKFKKKKCNFISSVSAGDFLFYLNFE